jgi:hypothetical protein
LYPNEGGIILQNFNPLRTTLAAKVFITLAEQGAMINNLSPLLITGLRTFSICKMFSIDASQTNIHSSFF